VSPKNSTNLLARYSNEDLWRTTGQEKMELQIKRKRWGPGVGGSAQTKYQHHQAGLEMESTGKAEEREAKEQLATVNRRWSRER